MAESKPVSNTKYYIHSVIAIAIMVIVRLIPAPYPLTPGGMIIISALLGAIYGWFHGNLFWVSIFALISIGVTDVGTIGGLFASLFGNTNVIFLIFFFTFVGYLNLIGFPQVIAQKILSSKLTKGRPWVLVLCMMLSGIIPASIMSVTAMLVLTLALINNVCDEAGLEKNDKFRVTTVVATTSVVALSFTIFPFMISAVTMIGIWHGLGFEYSYFPFLPYMAFTVVIKGVAITAVWATLRWIIRPDVSKLKSYVPPGNSPKFNADQRFALALIGLLFLLFMAPTLLPDGTAVHRFFAQFGMQVVIAIVLVVGTFARNKQGRPQIDFSAAATKQLAPMFPVIVMVGTTLVLSDLIGRAEFGFAAFITANVAPMLDVGSATLFTILVMVITFLLTACLPIPLLRGLFPPILFPLLQTYGFPVMPFIMVWSFTLLAGNWLPSSGAIAAIMHGDVGSKNALKYMPIFMIVLFIVALVVGIPLGNLIFT